MIRRNVCVMLAVLGLCRAGWGLVLVSATEDVPLEVLVTTAQAVVVGTVQANAPAETVIGGEGGPAAQVRMFRRGSVGGPMQLKVEKVLTSTKKAELADKQIRVDVAGAAVPAAGTRVIVALTSADGDRWGTLYCRNAVSTHTDALAEKIKAASNLDAWAWSKEVNGLQAATIVRKVTPVNNQNTSWITLCVAFRNTSKESIWVNVFPGDRLFSLKSTWDGTPAPTRAPGAAAGIAFMPEQHAVELKPGACVFLTPGGENPQGIPFSVDPAGVEGRGVLTYKSERAAVSASGAKVWTGTLECPPLTLKIPDSPGAMPR